MLRKVAATTLLALLISNGLSAARIWCGSAAFAAHSETKAGCCCPNKCALDKGVDRSCAADGAGSNKCGISKNDKVSISIIVLDLVIIPSCLGPAQTFTPGQYIFEIPASYQDPDLLGLTPPPRA